MLILNIFFYCYSKNMLGEFFFKGQKLATLTCSTKVRVAIDGTVVRVLHVEVDVSEFVRQRTLVGQVEMLVQWHLLVLKGNISWQKL